jgi:23S rRNA (cytosine1962-C5)-methyltransferase
VKLLTPSSLKDYELLDTGNFHKLERFGEFILIRPEPQAVWDCSMTEKEWLKAAHVKFIPKSANSGEWKKLKQMPDRWNISYDLSGKKIKLRLALTAFKHVGVFPEQAVNWELIYESIKKMKCSRPSVLNLFAYTGAASLAARLAGAEVTHVDSVKQVVNWGRENMELSGLADIRWLVDDAMKFVQKELRRKKRYNGIILDPPAYGHGAGGESWKLERDINEMVKLVKELLEPEEHFLILNTYSLGFSSLIVENLARSIFPEARNIETGELYLADNFGKKLPLGVFVQLSEGMIT